MLDATLFRFQKFTAGPAGAPGLLFPAARLCDCLGSPAFLLFLAGVDHI